MKKRSILLACTAAALTAILGILVSSGMVSFSRGKSSTAATSSTGATDTSSASYINLPSGYPRPTNIAVDSNGVVWFWASTQQQVTLFHWIPGTTSLEQTAVGSPAHLGLITGVQNAIAIDNSGTAWLAANMNVVTVTPSTGATSSVSVPGLPVITIENSLRPTQLQGLQAISALAAGPDDQVAIAASDAAAIAVLNSSTRTFRNIPLPAGYEATDVAYTSDGTLAIDVASIDPRVSGNQLLLVPPGSQTVSLEKGIGGRRISVDGNQIYNGADATVVSTAGSQTTNQVAATALQNGSLSLMPSSAVTVLGSTVAFQTPSGIGLVGSSAASTFTLPTFSCGSTASGPLLPVSQDTAVTAPPDHQCAETATELVAAKNGIAFLPSGPTPSIGYLPQGDTSAARS